MGTRPNALKAIAVLGAAFVVLAVVLGVRARARPQALDPIASPGRSEAVGGPNEFVGSEACRECHTEIYDRWKETPMAKVLQDPGKNPAAILGDFDTPNELVTFTKDDVTVTYGMLWKQRYFKQVGNTFIVLPAQWDVLNKVWRRYNPQEEWWAEFYPKEQEGRPTRPLCDGCHSVNLDINAFADEPTVTEWNVGCEACHGAGGAHLEDPVVATIVNPARLDHVRADDTCIQCHSQGKPLENPIGGEYYDWPVGYEPGDRLADHWALEEHRLGEETATHWPDGTAHKNRMQGNDHVQSFMYVKGVTCYACHDVHGTENRGQLRFPGNQVCTQCHQPNLQPGPAGSLEFHTQHEADGEGSPCVACHMPPIQRTIADVMVRSHTYEFISPAKSEMHGIPNPCVQCHTEETNEWALEYLKKWPSYSPWRVAH